MKKVLSLVLAAVLLLSTVACNSHNEHNHDAVHKCVNCNSENVVSANFCNSCGASLSPTGSSSASITESSTADTQPDNSTTSQDSNTTNAQDSVTKSESTNSPVANKTKTTAKTTKKSNVATKPDPADDIWLMISSYEGGSGYNRALESEYYYNYDGQLVEEYSYVVIPSGNGAKYTYRYCYDSKGTKTKYIWYYFPASAASYVNSNTYSCTYDSAGRLATFTSGNTKTTYAYDTKGNLTASESYFGDFSFSDKTIYENGKETITYSNVCSKKIGIGPEWAVESEIIYDKSGKPAKKISYKSYVNNTWYGAKIDGYTIKETVVNFVTDSHGNILKKVFENSADYCTYTYMSLSEYRKKGLHKKRYGTNGQLVDIDSSLYYDGSDAGSNGGGNNSGSGNGGSGGAGTYRCTMCGTFGAPIGKKECSACDGEGKVLYKYVNGEKVMRSCPNCSGSGYKTCVFCGGDGVRGD